MNINLVVTQGFGAYVKGDHIVDTAIISEILAGEFSGHVVRIHSPSPLVTPAQER